MKRSYLLFVGFVCLLLMIAGVACRDGNKGELKENPKGAGASSHKSKGERPLMIALDIEPDEGFDPLLGWGGYGTSLFQSTLLKRNSDQEIEGDLAVTWDLTEDRRTWQIRIRQDAVFSGGTPLTAEDVAFTFNQAARSGGKTDVTVLKQAVATGKYTVDLHLKAPQITFIYRLITMGIVPAGTYKVGAYGRKPVGSGPYRLVQWDQGRRMIMEANPLYYGEKPSIKKVIFLFMEEDAAFASARAGAVHVIRVPQVLARQDIPGMTLYDIPSVDNRGISFPFIQEQDNPTVGGNPMGNDVTADIAIRKAVNYAVNRKQLVEGILEGFGSPAHGPVSTLPWDQPAARIQDGDLEKARQILVERGWRDTDKDGIREKNGLKASFTLLYPANDTIRQSLALAVSDTARKVGIDMVVTGKSWDNIYSLMHANAVLFGWGSFDQTEMHNLYFSECPGEAMHNAGLYRNKTVDQYLAKAMTAPSEKAAIAYWQKAQWDGETGFSAKGDAAWAWLVNLDHTYFVDSRLDIGNPGIEQHGSFIIANLPQWRWTPKKNSEEG